MKRGLLFAILLTCLLPSVPSEVHAGPYTPALHRHRPQVLSEFDEPGLRVHRQPIPLRRIIGFLIAGLSGLAILLLAASLLMGPGRGVEGEETEPRGSDPFFTVVAILLLVLLLVLVQAYYDQLVAWLKVLLTAD